MRPLAFALVPVTRRMIYRSGETRLPVEGTDLRLRHGDVELRGWTINPGRPRALVYFGGNSDDISWMRPEVERRFPEHTGYLLPYRGYGASEGRPSERALLSDALFLVDHVARLHPDVPVDVIGRSLGSGVAVQVAVRRPVERLVLVTPFDSLVATAADLCPAWLPVRWLVRDRWDSAAVAGRLGADVLVIRAGRDEVVPPPRTAALLRALPPGAREVALLDADHSDVVAHPSYWPPIIEFLHP